MSEREAQEWQSRTRRGRERRPPAGKENRPANLAGPSAKAQAPKPLGHPCRSAEPDRERMSSSTRGSIANMDELKQRIAGAQAADIARLLAPSNLAFQPRAAAFTTLVAQCGKVKAWEKALAVFEALRQTPGMKANTISYSAVISACSSAGRWQEAEQLFSEMDGDDCSPNAITFSCLISACERGGQFDRALDWFQRMQQSGVDADGIIYSSLVAACIRKDMLAKAMQLLDQAHSQGTLAPSDTYTRLLQHCCRGQHYQQATEIFLSMQAAGGEADHEVLLAMFMVLEQCSRPASAAGLLQSCTDAGVPDMKPLQLAAMKCYARAGAVHLAEALAAQAELKGDSAMQQLLKAARQASQSRTHSGPQSSGRRRHQHQAAANGPAH